MKAGDVYKDDDFAQEREAIEKQDAIEKERQVALRRKEADRAWLERQTQRARGLAAKYRVSEDEGWRLLRQEDELEHALDWFSRRLKAYEEAALYEESRLVAASPWLAERGATEQMVERKAAPIAIKAAAPGKGLVDATGRFSGIAAAFGGGADSYGDIIEAGAFTETLREAKAAVRPYLWPLLYQHDTARPIGGVAAARERSDGLYVDCVLDMDTRDGREAHSLLSKGFLSGLSIGYITERERMQGNTRLLLKIKLLEASIVTFPANSAAQVDRVA